MSGAMSEVAPAGAGPLDAVADGTPVDLGRGRWAARDGLGGVVIARSEDEVSRLVRDRNGEDAE